MTATSARYMRERGQTELALQMIAFEARTHTIRRCTGLSDDRIRRLYSTYFKDGNGQQVRRQRGKSPRRTEIFTSNLENERHAASLASLFVQFDLLAEEQYLLHSPANPGIAYGIRFCRAFALYSNICAPAVFCFERAWSLCEALRERNELAIRNCNSCNGIFVYDILSLRAPVCSCCRIKKQARNIADAKGAKTGARDCRC
ncbi:MAG: hypothetical protein HKN70_10975 [Gammaproteobacteria bacterium]|nr:hypothetical protein [Gammaproteobacteria bacterium]